MKMVRYAIGAVGAAPALGLLMPAAPAPAAAPAAKPVAKSVALAHTGHHPAASCRGSKHTSYSYIGLGWKIWYTAGAHSTCIGTVEASGYTSSSPNGAFDGYRVRIYGNESKNSTINWTRTFAHPLYLPPGTDHHDFEVHRGFGNDVKVCLSARSVYSGVRTWQATCPVLPG